MKTIIRERGRYAGEEMLSTEAGEFLIIDHLKAYVMRLVDFEGKTPDKDKVFEVVGHGEDEMGFGVRWAVLGVKEEIAKKAILCVELYDIKTPHTFNPTPQCTTVLSDEYLLDDHGPDSEEVNELWRSKSISRDILLDIETVLSGDSFTITSARTKVGERFFCVANKKDRLPNGKFVTIFSGWQRSARKAVDAAKKASEFVVRRHNREHQNG